MGGGTWIYLGTFGFDAGKNNACKVTLSNRSVKAGQIVTADAVKIGGGMGNIARRISEEGATDNLKSSDKAVNSSNGTGSAPATHQPSYVAEYQKSGYPRFCEAARYCGNGRVSRTACIPTVMVKMITLMIIRAVAYG